MIKKLSILFSILLVQGAMSAFAQGYVMKIHDANAAPGEVVKVSIEIINETPVVAFQMDIPLPKGFEYVDNSIEIASARKADHVAKANMMNNSNALRIICFSLSNSYFKGDSGAVMTFSLKTPKTEGTYKLEMNEAIVSDTSAVNLLTKSKGGTVTLKK